MKKKAGMLAGAAPELTRYLNQVSKAALIDIVCDLAAGATGSGDEPASLGDLRKYIEPVLHARGDRIPKGE